MCVYTKGKVKIRQNMSYGRQTVRKAIKTINSTLATEHTQVNNFQPELPSLKNKLHIKNQRPDLQSYLKTQLQLILMDLP